MGFNFTREDFKERNKEDREDNLTIYIHYIYSLLGLFIFVCRKEAWVPRRLMLVFDACQVPAKALTPSMHLYHWVSH